MSVRWARLSPGLALGCAIMACAEPTAEPPCVIDFELEPAPRSLYPTPTPCDPRIAPATTPRIQPPVVVGVTDDGRLYVIDRIDGGYGRPEVIDRLTPRVFVEEEGVLVRKPGGLGSSQSTKDHLYDAFAGTDPDFAGMTRVRRKPGYPRNIIPSEAAMVLFEAPVTGGPDPGDVFEQGAPLRVLPECAVDDHAVEDLPQARHIEYVAQDEMGIEILVTVPAIDWDVRSAKVFYGPPDAVLERHVVSFTRERDGGTTHIAFLIDGVEVTLHFWYGCNGPFTSDCEGTLELPDRTLAVSIPSRDEAMLAGNTYVCHDPHR